MSMLRFKRQRPTVLSPLHTFPGFQERVDFFLLPRAERIRQFRVFFCHNNVPLMAILKICGYQKAGHRRARSGALMDFLHHGKDLGFPYERKLFALYYNLRFRPHVLPSSRARAAELMKEYFDERGVALNGDCPSIDKEGEECNCFELVFPPEPLESDFQTRSQPSHEQVDKLYDDLTVLVPNAKEHINVDRLPEGCFHPLPAAPPSGEELARPLAPAPLDVPQPLLLPLGIEIPVANGNYEAFMMMLPKLDKKTQELIAPFMVDGKINFGPGLLQLADNVPESSVKKN